MHRYVKEYVYSIWSKLLEHFQVEVARKKPLFITSVKSEFSIIYVLLLVYN